MMRIGSQSSKLTKDTPLFDTDLRLCGLKTVPQITRLALHEGQLHETIRQDQQDLLD